MKPSSKLPLSKPTLLLVCTLLMLPWSQSSFAADLLQVYELARKNDAQLMIAEANYLAASQGVPLAESTNRPQLSLGGTGSVRETDESNSGRNSSSNAGFNVNLTQSLFNTENDGNISVAEANTAAELAVLKGARQGLLLRAARAYFAILAATDNVEFTYAERNAIARQLEEAQKRFEVGLIAITDVQESQAAYDQAIANEIGAKRQLATAREFLREITGEYVTKLSAPKDDMPLRRPERSEREWVDLSLSQNLNLVASRLDEELARDEISFRRTGHYPTLDLVVRTGSQKSEGNGSTTFPGPPAVVEPYSSDDDRNFDSISLQFNVPLFAGGGTSSRVREAVYLHRAAREQLQRVTRETERQSRDAYLGVLAEESRVKALKQAVASSQTALEATQAGFDVGTRTIVDVLNSQFALYAAKTNYQRSRYDYILNALRLKQAAGTLQVQDLEQIDQWLAERKPPEEVIAEEEAAKESGS